MKKKAFDIEPQKFEKDSKYRDIKPAGQGGDNDMDRETPSPDDAKKATDEAYSKNQSGAGMAPSSNRQ